MILLFIKIFPPPFHEKYSKTEKKTSLIYCLKHSFSVIKISPFVHLKALPRQLALFITCLIDFKICIKFPITIRYNLASICYNYPIHLIFGVPITITICLSSRFKASLLWKMSSLSYKILVPVR